MLLRADRQSIKQASTLTPGSDRNILQARWHRSYTIDLGFANFHSAFPQWQTIRVYHQRSGRWVLSTLALLTVGAAIAAAFVNSRWRGLSNVR
jgi:hypothetical protein